MIQFEEHVFDQLGGNKSTQLELGILLPIPLRSDLEVNFQVEAGIYPVEHPLRVMVLGKF